MAPQAEGPSGSRKFYSDESVGADPFRYGFAEAGKPFGRIMKNP